MAKVGSVLQYGDSIYLVTTVKEDGGVIAQLCGGTPQGFSPVPGVTLHLSKERVDACKVLGVAEEI